MASVVVGCMCVQSNMTGIIKIKPKSGILPEGLFYCLLTCYHCNRTNRVRGCAKFYAHTHYHCQVINTNRYNPVINNKVLPEVTIAMATIVVDCM